MSALPTYIVARLDIGPVIAAMATAKAWEEMECGQSNDIDDETMFAIAVPHEAALRDVIAEAVVNNDYVAVGSNDERDQALIAVIGPTTGAGPLLRVLIDQQQIHTDGGSR